jgi:hypothetical protein
VTKKKHPDRWLIVAWNNGGERSPRLWSVDEDGKVLLSEAAALQLVKTIDSGGGFVGRAHGGFGAGARRQARRAGGGFAYLGDEAVGTT